MAVVTSGSETIIRYSRLPVSLNLAALGIIGLQTWSVVSWIIGRLSFALPTIQVYTLGRPDGVRRELPVLAFGRGKRLKWDETGDIMYESNRRRRFGIIPAYARLRAERKGVVLTPQQTHP